jgi:hypothetical protein
MIIETQDGQGNVISRVDDGRPVEPEPIPAEVVAAQAISDEITIRLEPAVTITEIKSAITDGLAAAITSLGGQQ